MALGISRFRDLEIIDIKDQNHKMLHALNT